MNAVPLPVDPAGEYGGVTIEYGIVVATIALALAAVGGPLINAVTTFFDSIPALFP